MLTNGQTNRQPNYSNPRCACAPRVNPRCACEIGRRILCLSKHHADLAPLIGLHLPSMKARILIRKLNFLAKLLSSTEDTLSTRTFRTFAAENVYDISLVQQCHWLEQSLRIDSVSQQCLANPDSATSLVKSAQNNVLRQDWANTIHLAKSHVSLKHIASCDDIALCWCRIWDSALDKGLHGTRLSQCLFKSLCLPLFGERRCKYCTAHIPLTCTFFEHLCHSHLDFNASLLPPVLENCGHEVFNLAAEILSLQY